MKPPAPAVARTSDGRVADPRSASELGRLGAAATNARRRQLRALESLGLRGAPTEALVPYLPDAEAFAASEVERLAREVGGGVCAGAACSFVQSAALQLAGSRCAFSSGDLALGSRLADASRQNLLAAHELCAREAMARNRPGVRGLTPRAEADAVVALAVARATQQASAGPEFDAERDDEDLSA